MPQRLDVDAVAARLHAGVGLLARRLRKLPAPGELTLPERSVLSRLDHGGPSTAADLARAEQVTAQAMGGTLGPLEERGLVARRRDPGDGRRLIMSLTDAGSEVLRRKRDARARQLAAALTDEFDEAELATLAAAAPLLERLGESL